MAKTSKALELEISKLRKLIVQLYAMHEIEQEISFSGNLDLLTDCIKSIIKALDIDEFCIMLLNSRDGLVVKSFYGLPSSAKDKILFELGEGVSGSVAETGKAVLIPDVKKDSRFLFYKGLKKNIGSFISVPLTDSGKIMGVLNVHKKEANTLNQDDLELLRDISSHIMLSIKNAKVYEKIKRISVKDDLTEIYNRRYISAKLDEEIQKSKGKYPVSIIMTELKYLRGYNDCYGYLQGEQLLREIALVLQSKVRTCDRVARYSGQHFMIFLPKTSKNRALLIGEKLREHINAFLKTKIKTQPESKLIFITASASYPADAGASAGLIKSVDAALKKHALNPNL